MTPDSNLTYLGSLCWNALYFDSQTNQVNFIQDNNLRYLTPNNEKNSKYDLDHYFENRIE